MSVKVNRLALLEQEMARIALVLSDASFDQYEAAVAAVTEAINGMPDVLPDYEPTLYRITKNTDAARFATENGYSRPAAAVGLITGKHEGNAA